MERVKRRPYRPPPRHMKDEETMMVLLLLLLRLESRPYLGWMEVKQAINRDHPCKGLFGLQEENVWGRRFDRP